MRRAMARIAHIEPARVLVYLAMICGLTITSRWEHANGEAMSLGPAAWAVPGAFCAYLLAAIQARRDVALALLLELVSTLMGGLGQLVADDRDSSAAHALPAVRVVVLSISAVLLIYRTHEIISHPAGGSAAATADPADAPAAGWPDPADYPASTRPDPADLLYEPAAPPADPAADRPDPAAPTEPEPDPLPHPDDPFAIREYVTRNWPMTLAEVKDIYPEGANPERARGMWRRVKDAMEKEKTG